MCANVSFYEHPDGADHYSSQIEEILEPVLPFIGSWFDTLLVSISLDYELIASFRIAHGPKSNE